MKVYLTLIILAHSAQCGAIKDVIEITFTLANSSYSMPIFCALASLEEWVADLVMKHGDIEDIDVEVDVNGLLTCNFDLPVSSDTEEISEYLHIHTNIDDILIADLVKSLELQ